MIIEAKSGKKVECYFRSVSKEEIKQEKYSPSGKWDFDWMRPVLNGFEIFALSVDKHGQTPQGLVAVKAHYEKGYEFVELDIVESSPANKKVIQGKGNKERIHIGVGRCLIAFACWYSFNKGLDGFMKLTSKSSKLDLYSELGGHRNGQEFIFYPMDSMRLCKQYFPGGVKVWQDQ
ncbi:hypothetical protein SAMN04488137_4544 [Fictibacillus solisalsi]|uniref:N-acetyltransferase domain-containing protein n=1 Tax=Fictibacillus solisalsi TaxID=459525 RepID=A0A1H0BL31_9BACL|nr:hypothetical protein [Fictibacillus solisalsi]SDN46354.1 hypothetical protein SAMN04488137_4544 [Fictibacillus solisalsi]